MKNLEIKIIGEAGSGKSSLALLLKKLLKDHVNKLTVNDEDYPNISDDSGSIILDSVNLKINVVQSKREIKVKI